jgi:hypothetical protein
MKGAYRRSDFCPLFARRFLSLQFMRRVTGHFFSWEWQGLCLLLSAGQQAREARMNDRHRQECHSIIILTDL